MNRIQYPPVYVGLYVLLIASLAAVTGAQMPGAGAVASLLFWALFYAAGLVCGWKYNQSGTEAFKNVTNALVVLFLLLCIVAIFVAGFDKAFVLLLIGIQAARNFTLSIRRDFYYSYVISLILVLYGASLSKEAFFILYIIIYVLAGMFTLMADHIDDTLSRAKGGDREVLIRRMRLPVKGAGLSVAVMVLSLAIYLAVPRPPSPHVQAFPAGGWNYSNKSWENQAKMDEHGDRSGNPTGQERFQNMPDDQEDSRTGSAPEYGGFQKSFDISKANVQLPDDIVFYLQADRPLYVRAKTFDLFDGRVWSASTARGRKVANKNGFTLDKSFRGDGTGQTFTIAAELPSSILAAYRPIMLWFPGNVVHQESDFALRAPGTLKKGTVYSVLSDDRERNGRPCSEGERLDDPGRYLQLPDNLSQRVRELGGTVTQNAHGPLAKAEAVESHLKTNYFYTLNTALTRPDSNVIDEFLFETKQGHCEYFASSMTVMLRSVNVPARLVTGYVADRENSITGYYEVRRNNAHAWVEAYIDGYGWMTFEPTSSFTIPNGSKRLFAASGVFSYLEDSLSRAVRSNPGTWWADVVRRIMEYLKRLWNLLQRLFEALWAFGKDIAGWFLSWGWKILILILASAGAAYPLYRFAASMGEKIDLTQLRKKDARRFIVQCYREMERQLSRKKLPRRPFCSPTEYLRIVALKLPHLTSSVEEITILFNRVMYGACSVGAAEADSAFAAYRSLVENIDGKSDKIKKQKRR